MPKPDSHPQMTASQEALVREILMRVADHWTLLIVDALHEDRSLRFSQVKERVGGISAKMLTKTLRLLERDGLVTRLVHAVVPPRVDYQLTPLGESLGESLCGVWLWAEANCKAVDLARARFDRDGSGSALGPAIA